MNENGPIDEPRLKKQAEELREAGRLYAERPFDAPFAGWKKALILTLTLASMAAAVLLLMFPGRRQEWLQESLNRMEVVTAGNESPVFELPPPRPERFEPRIMVQGPVPMISSSDPDAPLYSEDAPVPREQEPAGEREFRPPEKTPEAIAAYNLIREKSALIRNLVDGTIEGYRFLDWQPQKIEPPQFWLNLRVNRLSDGRPLDLIWMIDIETGQVRPLSQAARDFEAEQGRSPS